MAIITGRLILIVGRIFNGISQTIRYHPSLLHAVFLFLSENINDVFLKDTRCGVFWSHSPGLDQTPRISSDRFLSGSPACESTKNIIHVRFWKNLPNNRTRCALRQDTTGKTSVFSCSGQFYVFASIICIISIICQTSGNKTSKIHIYRSLGSVGFLMFKFLLLIKTAFNLI